MSLSAKFGTKSNEEKARDAYNAALKAKYGGDWEKSLRLNQKADKLRGGDEATIWNLGIAATALSKWDEAREAWRAYGIKVNDGPGEVQMAPLSGCIRLNADVCGETVWGTRIDPARTRIRNVPLPESERRYGDIVLNDGAPIGTRMSNGVEYSVLNELMLWKASEYSTYAVNLEMPSDIAVESLVKLCDEVDIGIEDWGTARILCKACSEGTPGEHTCEAQPSAERRYGFGAKSEAVLRNILRRWQEMEDGSVVRNVELVVSGVNA